MQNQPFINPETSNQIPTSSLERKLFFSELEINNEFDERIDFTHYFSVFNDFNYANPKTEPFPFLIQREFLYSSFEDIRPLQEPSKESIASIKGRIQQFSNSRDEKYKKQFLGNITEYAETIGIAEASQYLIPSLAKIVDDSMSIKSKFLSVLQNFIDFLAQNGDLGYSSIKTSILDIIDDLYQPKQYEMIDDDIKKLLYENLVTIGKTLLLKDMIEKILNIIYRFASNGNKEPMKSELKILSIKLIGRLVNEFGKETTENYLLAQIISFSEVEDANIRQHVIKILPNICEVVSPEIIKTKIYDIIKRLSNDLIWSIRKGCVEVIPKIIKINKERSLYYHIQINNIMYVEVIEKLIIDNQKYVRFTVLEKIGEIVAQLEKEELSQKLFDFYINSIEEYYFNIKGKLNIEEAHQINRSHSYSNSLSFDVNIYFYAYNFPAILYCYGSSYWPKLKKIYFNLCKENDYKIIGSLISSFHEIAAILGEKIVESELLPIYDTFLESQNKNLKNIALRNLPKILRLVSKETKEKYFKYFEAVSLFQKNNDNRVNNFNFLNWKNKLDVVESILCYYNLYEFDVIYTSILPQCITFCLDDIYKVRSVSAKVLGNLIVHLYINNYKKENIFQLLSCFAYNKQFKSRITFIKMCKVLLMCYPLYKENILDKIKQLSYDKIIDVRIALAKLLIKTIKNDKCPCFNDKDILILCNRIKQGKSKSIQSLFTDINLKYTDDNDNNNNNNINTINLQPKNDKDFSFIVNEFKIDINENSSQYYINEIKDDL